MKFCSFSCAEADPGRAQHAACLAVNGVYCKALGCVIPKGRPCPAPTRGKPATRPSGVKVARRR